MAVASVGGADVAKMPSNAKTTYWAIATAVLLLILALIGLRSFGFLGVSATSPQTKSLQAEGNSPDGNLLRAEGKQPEPTLGIDQKTMPDEIRRWLEHLERIEKRKEDLSFKQLGQATASLGNIQQLRAGLAELLGEDSEQETNPSEAAKQAIDDLRPDWRQLVADFESFPPPEECRQIGSDYGRALKETAGMMGDINGAIIRAEHDPSAALESLYRMQGQSGKAIDRYYGDADHGVANICRKYDTRKWFDIKADIGGGLLGRIAP